MMNSNDSVMPEKIGRSSSSLGWVRQELDRLEGLKANRETVKSEIRRLEATMLTLDKDIEEAKTMCKEAQQSADKPHDCLQENTLTDLKQRTTDLLHSTENMGLEVGRWVWFRKALVPLSGAVTLLAITAIIAFVRLGSDVVDTKESVQKVSSEVVGLKTAVEKKRATEDNQINTITREVRKAISDAKTLAPVSDEVEDKPRNKRPRR